MLRPLHILTPYAQGTTLQFMLCDRYLRSVGEESKTAIVESDGTLSLELEVNSEESCWVAEQDKQRMPMWVYEGEERQEIDLSSPLYKRKHLPTLLQTDDRTLVANAERTMTKVFCGSPVVSNEEKRFLLRHCTFQENNDDEEMCKVDRLLEEKFNNG